MIEFKTLEIFSQVILATEKNNPTEEDLDLVTEISLDSADIAEDFSPVFLEDLKRFKNLEELNLGHITMDKKATEIVFGLSNLKRLSFFECEIEDVAGINNLKALERLETCRTPFDVSKLKNPHLQNLLIIGASLESLEIIPILGQLRDLGVVNCKLKDKRLSEFLTVLRRLNICHTEIENIGLINALPKLENVCLDEKVFEKNSALFLKAKHLEFTDELGQELPHKKESDDE